MLCLQVCISEKDKKSKCIKKGFFVQSAKKLTSQKQKKGFEERTKQIEIAKKKGIKHLGS